MRKIYGNMYVVLRFAWRGEGFSLDAGQHGLRHRSPGQQVVWCVLIHRALLDEHFRVVGHTTWYESVEQMQEDFDKYLHHYNYEGPQQGRMMNGRTPS